MSDRLRHYLPEILVFGAVLVVLLVCLAPAPTWINTDSDGIHDTYAAKYLYLSHHTSMPLYLIIGHFFTLIPFGTDFWRLALFSALATLGSCVFIYLIVLALVAFKRKARWYALVAVVAYGSSAVVISQSTIVETYALVTMIGLGAYYFSLRKRWYLCALMLGLGLAVHLLAVIPLLVIYSFNRELRHWRTILITFVCLLLYSYVGLSVWLNPDQPNMWGNKDYLSLISDVWMSVNFLFGTLAIYDFPKRLLDGLGLMVVSLNLALVPMGYYFYCYKNPVSYPLFWLFILPLVVYLIGLPPQFYVYVLPSIAFGSVIMALGLARMDIHWLWVVLACLVGFMCFNAHYFDIGRTLDPELSANRFVTEELPKVPDGAYVMPYSAWEWASVFSYNKNEGKSLKPISIDMLVDPVYQRQLVGQGVRFEDSKELDRFERQNALALSIVRLNDNVWTTRTTDARTYGSEVILAKGNEAVVEKLPVEEVARWHFKPSNPYDIITGAIEINEWGFITLSSWTVLFYVEWGGTGFFLYWLIFVMPAWRRKI